MSKPNDDSLDLTVVYEDAGAGRLTASIAAVPGTISWGRTQADARSNVVDAFRTMLSVEPETIPDGARAEASPGVRRAIWDSTASSGT